MHLNTKSDRAHVLAREHVRAQTGRKGLAQRLEALAEACAALPLLDDCPIDDILYDPQGLPKRNREPGS